MSKNILIASVLKPVDDTRMLEKLAVSIRNLTGFSINVVGFKGKITEHDKISVVPLFNFDRVSFLKRLFAGVRFLIFALNSKPDYLIINTHELVLPAILLKWICNTTIIYDIRENYILNTKHATHYSTLSKILIQSLLKWRNYMAHLFMDYFILAEKIYQKQMNFPPDKTYVLENKCSAPNFISTKTERNPFQIIFTGTLAEHTGIFECIIFFKTIHQTDPRWNLVIAGHCALPEILKKIKINISDNNSITLIGGENHVPHSVISHLIMQSGIGFIHYRNTPIVKNKMPTKLYEYLGYKLQILFYEPNEWIAFAEKYQPILCPSPIDRSNPSNFIQKMIPAIQETYTTDPDLYWETEWEKSGFKNIFDLS